jgi:hypothetical protein
MVFRLRVRVEASDIAIVVAAATIGAAKRKARREALRWLAEIAEPEDFTITVAEERDDTEARP